MYVLSDWLLYAIVNLTDLQLIAYNHCRNSGQRINRIRKDLSAAADPTHICFAIPGQNRRSVPDDNHSAMGERPVLPPVWLPFHLCMFPARSRVEPLRARPLHQYICPNHHRLRDQCDLRHIDTSDPSRLLAASDTAAEEEDWSGRYIRHWYLVSGHDP